jgi:hypothetical protein
MANLPEKLVELEAERGEIVQLQDILIGTMRGVCLGKLTVVKKTGEILVDYPDNPFGPLPARSTISITLEDENRDLLLIFEKNDPRLPIIVGLIQEKPVILTKEILTDQQENIDIFADGKRIVFQAKKEIELRCGKSSLIMKQDGKMVMKGTQLLSRASRVNKIKGSAVRIN